MVLVPANRRHDGEAPEDVRERFPGRRPPGTRFGDGGGMEPLPRRADRGRAFSRRRMGTGGRPAIHEHGGRGSDPDLRPLDLPPRPDRPPPPADRVRTGGNGVRLLHAEARRPPSALTGTPRTAIVGGDDPSRTDPSDPPVASAVRAFGRPAPPAPGAVVAARLRSGPRRNAAQEPQGRSPSAALAGIRPRPDEPDSGPERPHASLLRRPVAPRPPAGRLDRPSRSLPRLDTLGLQPLAPFPQGPPRDGLSRLEAQRRPPGRRPPRCAVSRARCRPRWT